MMLLSQAAQALHARMEGADVRFTAVSTDTRTIRPGDLFIALKGENFDGAKFVADALKAGAVAAVVNAQGYEHIRPVHDPRCLNPDCGGYASGARATRRALAQTVRHPSCCHHRQQRQDHGEGNAGGYFASARPGTRKACWPRSGNFNNDIGMPLTLLRLRATHRLCGDRDGHESSEGNRLPHPHRATRCGAGQQCDRRTFAGPGFGGRRGAGKRRNIRGPGRSRYGRHQCATMLMRPCGAIWPARIA